jgi:hypothetical protein
MAAAAVVLPRSGLPALPAEHVCLVTERDPITLAKQVASLDRLSGGRFLFGVGAGWNRAEMANHGTDRRTRMALLADRLSLASVPRLPAAWSGGDGSAYCYGSSCCTAARAGMIGPVTAWMRARWLGWSRLLA